MSGGRWTSEKVYIPETISIAETVKNLQKSGKLPLVFNRQSEEEAATDLRPADKLDGAIIPLNINDVHVYDRNPRLSRNPAHAEIKESIRKRGLIGCLTVTKRPQSDKYILYMGGNTRLQIVKELYAETSDQIGRASCRERV